jgi:hypothetical protein
MRKGLLAAAMLLLTVASVAVRPAGADPAGPPLDVPAAMLARGLRCHSELAAGPTPVLLVPGTALTPDVNFDWNYEKVFSATGRPWCALTLPHHGMSDVQVAGEYVVYALRTMYARAHRRVSVVGFSQGGMVPRWALKWWPDTRAMVDDVVGIDPSNHGTLDAVGVCLLPCAPSFWQQRTGSKFLLALNAGAETYAGISYTQVYSIDDEVVVPNLGPAASSALHTGAGEIANIAAQSLCPLHLADHLTMGSIDPVAYAVVVDAITHPGPAVPSRIPRRVCTQLLMPGVSPAAALQGELRVGNEVAAQVAGYPRVSAEPPLAAYARG